MASGHPSIYSFAHSNIFPVAIFFFVLLYSFFFVLLLYISFCSMFRVYLCILRFVMNMKSQNGNFRAEIWDYFLGNCLKNLHIVLCMSPANNAMRAYCRTYPGLLGHTALNVIRPWSDVALEAVAKTFVSEHLSIRTEYVEPIDKHAVHVHKSVQFYSNQFRAKLQRRNFVTLRNLMDYMHTYLKLIGTLHTCFWSISTIARICAAIHYDIL